MLINCVICGDIFDSSSETYSTTCGHLFHYACLNEWLKRSKSCPHCRSETTENTIHRVFFNVQTETVDDVGSLRNQIENLKCSVQMKDVEVKNATDEANTLKTRNLKLREEFQKYEEKVTTLKMVCASYKEHIKCLKKQVKEGIGAKEAVCELRNKLEVLQNVELVVKGTLPEVEAMLSNCSWTSESQKAMITYTTVLKRELNAAMERKREMRSKIDSLQKSLSVAQGDAEHLRAEGSSRELALRQLEEDLKHTEEEKKGLARKVRELEKAIVSPSGNPYDSALHRLLAESPAPDSVKKYLKRPKLTDPSKDMQENRVEVPLTPVRSSNSTCYVLKPRKSVNPSVLQRPRLNMSCRSSFLRDVPSSLAAAREESYDGLGGHSRRDDFPIPIVKTRPMSISMAQSKMKTVRREKKVLNATTLDTFIDFT